jgi:hypothetical protein
MGGFGDLFVLSVYLDITPGGRRGTGILSSLGQTMLSMANHSLDDGHDMIQSMSIILSMRGVERVRLVVAAHRVSLTIGFDD